MQRVFVVIRVSVPVIEKAALSLQRSQTWKKKTPSSSFHGLENIFMLKLLSSALNAFFFICLRRLEANSSSSGGAGFFSLKSQMWAITAVLSAPLSNARAMMQILSWLISQTPAPNLERSGYRPLKLFQGWLCNKILQLFYSLGYVRAAMIIEFKLQNESENIPVKNQQYQYLIWHQSSKNTRLSHFLMLCFIFLQSSHSACSPIQSAVMSRLVLFSWLWIFCPDLEQTSYFCCGLMWILSTVV